VAAEYVQRMGERIQERRKELGLTQLELALALPGKVGADQVSRWERGIHKPEDDTLEEIAVVLKVPVAYFLAEAPAPDAPTPSPFAGADALADGLRSLEQRMIDALGEFTQAVRDQNQALERQHEVLERIERALATRPPARTWTRALNVFWPPRTMPPERFEAAPRPPAAKPEAQAK
jgi:transcriptional regulator with XRE-family HTH domain